MKTIIVDDEPIMLKSFARLSRDVEGIELVGQFGDGKSALQYLETHPVDLACVDITMPVMNGRELAGILQEDYPGILIVFITAHDKDSPEAHNLEGDGYILKPYTRAMLEQLVEDLSMQCGA